VSEFQFFLSHFIPTRKNHSLFHWTCSRSSILPTRQHNEVPDSSAALLRKIETNCPVQPAYHEAVSDSRRVYPLTLHHNGRSGGPCILYAETTHTRAEWKNKLEEALGSRKIVQGFNKVFEIEYLSRDTFIMPSLALNNAGQAWTQENTFTGKVSCSFRFSNPPTTFSSSSN